MTYIRAHIRTCTLLLLVLPLLGCRGGGLPVTATTGPGGTPVVAATESPMAVGPVATEAVGATGTPTPAGALRATEAPVESTALPSPTSLVEGLGVRLGTPDPNLNCPNHSPWFFENVAQECADIVMNTWIAWQPFERGLMVWVQEQGPTYVLLDDGSLFKTYRQVRDLQGLPLPEPDPSLALPPGLYQPERGFALFWRGLAPGSEWVRESLGWATEPETAYSALWQCNTAVGEAARCYFNGPRDEIVAMTMGGPMYWNYWQRAVR